MRSAGGFVPGGQVAVPSFQRDVRYRRPGQFVLGGAAQRIDTSANGIVGFACKYVVIQFSIGNAHLALIGLAAPKAGRGGLFDYVPGNAQV